MFGVEVRPAGVHFLVVPKPLRGKARATAKKFRKLIRWALVKFRDLGSEGGGPHARTYQRHATSEALPQASTAKEMVERIWERCAAWDEEAARVTAGRKQEKVDPTAPLKPDVSHPAGDPCSDTADKPVHGAAKGGAAARAPAGKKSRKEQLIALLAPLVEDLPINPTANSVAELVEESIESARISAWSRKPKGPPSKPRPAGSSRRRRRRDAASRTQAGTRASASAADRAPVIAYVDALLGDAGMPVRGGQATVDSSTQVDLTPLYDYLGGLLRPAVIPNYFPGLSEIPLDDLYVELTTSEDVRSDTFDPGGSGNGGSRSADPVAAWRDVARAKRVPLEALISSTDSRPAVLLGDPGSGKSTLMQYALHAVARGAVSGSGLQAGKLLPFRIALREFAKEGRQDEFQVIRFIIRRMLGVSDPRASDDWRSLLTHLFWDKRPFRLLLLIDGIDEVTPDPDAFTEIRTKLKEASSIARMLFTSRRAGFEPPVSHYDAFEIVELSEISIERLIAKWFCHVHPCSSEFVESFQRWVFEDPRRQEMCSNPCLLSLLCYLNQGRPAAKLVEARNRAELYQRAVEKLVSDPRSSLRPRQSTDLSTLEAFALDRYLFHGAGPVPLALFNREEMRQFLSSKRNADGSKAATQGLEVLDEVWLRTRLISQWNLGNWYHFLHLSFQEYFAARALATLPETEVAALVEVHRFNPFWMEIWRFYSGLCALAGGRGVGRFSALASRYVAPRDVCDQTLFLLAALCAEFGISDTRGIIGFDLRETLLAKVANESDLTRQHIRRAVDVDPTYFLERARSALAQQLHNYRQASRGRGSILDFNDVRMGLAILECVYRPDALAFRGELVEAELRCPWLKRDDPALGPSTPSGRNRSLRDLIERCLVSAPGPLQFERGVSYLACVQAPESATTILAIARRLSSLSAGWRPRKRRKSNSHLATELRVHCLKALCTLGATQGVELANELWEQPDFQQSHLRAAAAWLSRLRNTEVASLAERWLEATASTTSTAGLAALLELVADWDGRAIPARVDELAQADSTGPNVRAAAWQVIATRDSLHGMERLRARLRHLGQRSSLGNREHQEIHRLALFIELRRLPLFVELDALLAHHDCRASARVSGSLLAAAICVSAAHSTQGEHCDWLLSKAVPAFERLLLHAEAEDGPLEDLIHAFALSPVQVRKAVAGLIAKACTNVADMVRARLLQFYVHNPAFAPEEVVEDALLSDNFFVRSPAIEILLESDPGRVVASRASGDLMDYVLMQKSVRDGTLYFEGQLYSPQRLAFEPFSSQSRAGARPAPAKR